MITNIITQLKIKVLEKQMKVVREKTHFYRGTPIKMTVDFSSEIKKTKKTV